MPNISPNQIDYTRQIFHDQVEWFIKKYAPPDEKGYEHYEFIADFCLVIRDLCVNGQQAYQHVATEAFKQLHETIAKMPMPPIITQKEK